MTTFDEPGDTMRGVGHMGGVLLLSQLRSLVARTHNWDDDAEVHLDLTDGAHIRVMRGADPSVLGYVVGYDTTDGVALLGTSVDQTRVGAEHDLAQVTSLDGDEVGYRLLEVREVQP